MDLTNDKTGRLAERLNTSPYREFNFAVYGIGAVAKSVIDALPHLRIAGLMDKAPENTGKIIYGKRVLDYHEVIGAVDAVIIASSDVYWETIFKRIAFLKSEHGKEIFFTNGEIAALQQGDASVSGNPYWNVTAAQLEAAIDAHEVISFDVFDTLVLRGVSRPEDLLQVVEAEAKGLAMGPEQFLNARKQAEERCLRESGENFTIDDIYGQLAQAAGLPEAEAKHLRELEVAAEIDHAVPRQELLRLYRHCLAGKKSVYLISDIHLPLPVMEQILSRCGIEGYAGLLVSCEAGASKKSGALWERYARVVAGKTALHIGDSDRADVANPLPHGIDTFKVMGPYEMLLASSIRDAAVHSTTLPDSKAVGLLLARLFDNPFALSGKKGVPEISSLFDFGYVFFGPLLYNYFSWLTAELEAGRFDRVLFLAREGYLLEKLYAGIVRRLDRDDLPEGIYFKTSRRMASVAALKTAADVHETLKDSFSGTTKQLLNNRFGVPCRDEADSDEIMVNTDPRLKTVVDDHLEEILENAARERAGYLRYIREIGLKPGSRLALSDIGIKGSIQYYLGRFFDADFFGFYVTGFVGAWNPYGMADRTKALFPESPPGHGRPSNVMKYHILFESALAAPEGMYIKANPDGTFVNGPCFNNQRLFAQKAQLHAGIEAFILEMLELNGKAMPPVSPALVDEIFGLSMDGRMTIAPEVKETFFVDELFGVVNEKKIWD
ncbi:HAD family hydrolase [Geomesophilobacter sediminis]|uniref:Uncharacterized protein n=1 Tax=Geomesophilobacter sediminis TaxID=2798584 RepID=A0A8J7SAY2_9BACT|nr:hypothetical protein [Geomesophilobacter sediminis]MBJ6727750.1 hypothetical protein [Geomesophilobacter sediminis]